MQPTPSHPAWHPFPAPPTGDSQVPRQLRRVPRGTTVPAVAPRPNREARTAMGRLSQPSTLGLAIAATLLSLPVLAPYVLFGGGSPLWATVPLLIGGTLHVIGRAGTRNVVERDHSWRQSLPFALVGLDRTLGDRAPRSPFLTIRFRGPMPPRNLLADRIEAAADDRPAPQRRMLRATASAVRRGHADHLPLTRWSYTLFAERDRLLYLWCRALLDDVLVPMAARYPIDEVQISAKGY